MNRTKSQFARLRILDEEIRNGRYPNSLSFSVDYEVSERTVKRDFAFLRDQMGAPLEFSRERNGYYYIEKSWFLPAIVVVEGVMKALEAAIQMMEANNSKAEADALRGLVVKLTSFRSDQAAGHRIPRKAPAG